MSLIYCLLCFRYCILLPYFILVVILWVVLQRLWSQIWAVCLWFALTTIIHPLSSTSPAFPGLCISAKSYYYPSLYISLQFMKMIIVLVTRGSKGSEWKIGCGKLSLPTLAPRQPLLVLTKHFTSFTNFYGFYTSYLPSLTKKITNMTVILSQERETGEENVWNSN